MKDFALIENEKDLLYESKDFQFTKDNSFYVAQKLRIRLNTIKGEYFLNINQGIDYFNTVNVKNPNINNIEDLFKIEILNTPGVTELISFSLQIEKSTRVMSVFFKVQITSGEIVEVEV